MRGHLYLVRRKLRLRCWQFRPRAYIHVQETTADIFGAVREYDGWAE